MKQWEYDYITSVERWDAAHRIVGRTKAVKLYQESVVACAQFSKDHPYVRTVIDVGAGSGLVGFAWLSLSDAHSVCFIEPDLKKVAFLISIKADRQFKDIAQRMSVVSKKIEVVSRETVGLGQVPSSELAILSRAFSGESSLVQALEKSSLYHELKKAFYFIALPPGPGTKAFVFKEVTNK